VDRPDIPVDAVPDIASLMTAQFYWPVGAPALI
jgi:hypothetical protein